MFTVHCQSGRPSLLVVFQPLFDGYKMNWTIGKCADTAPNSNSNIVSNLVICLLELRFLTIELHKCTLYNVLPQLGRNL